MSLKDKTQMKDKYVNSIIHGDALQILSNLDTNSIDLILTDPPYFLDKMDNSWDEKKVASTKYHGSGKKFRKKIYRNRYK